jgi:molybdopterin-guanine dinucleotide biosynthesis protein A
MFSLVIQAGGRSSRMGRDKALLPFLGQPLIEYVASKFTPVCDDILVISPLVEQLSHFGWPVHPDLTPGVGPLMGLYTGLFHAKHAAVAMLACDMPFASPALFMGEERILLTGNHDVVIPVIAGKAEPLHAIYRRDTCLLAIESGLSSGMKRLIEWHPQVKVYEMEAAKIRAFDPLGRAFFNLNTPEDLRLAEEMAANHQD